MTKNSGFTLIEIIIALFIFAIVAAIATTGLHTILIARNRSNVAAQRLEELQITMTILSRDISQMINRPIKGSDGQQLPAFNIDNKNYLEFTHSGLSNPFALAKRSTLQRVAYFLKQHNLIRRTWPHLDRAPHTKPLDKVLLHHVQDIKFALITPHKHAIAVTFTLSDWGKIRRIFVIPIENVTS